MATPGPHVALVGLMGAGKSSAGRSLARSLGRPFVDLDKEIVRTAGASIPDLFATQGEEAFRDLESSVLADVLALEEPTVVATGGGVVLRPANVAALRARATVVWLRATPEALAARVGDGSGRPLLAGEEPVLDRLERLERERAPRYEAAAADGLVVDVDRRTRTQVVEEILRGLS